MGNIDELNNYTGQIAEHMNRSYRRLIEHYQKLDSEWFVREFLVRSEFLKRNFSKRQMKLLLLIYTYSISFGKDYAIIPSMQDFELCGVGKSHIRKELDKLVELDVIDWNTSANKFSIKSITEWKVPYHSGYRDNRSRDVFFINSKDVGIEVDEIITNFNE